MAFATTEGCTVTMCSVLIADSNVQLAQLVGQLLADEPGFRVLDVHNTTAGLLRAAEVQDPDVILLSERLGTSLTDDLRRTLRLAAPAAKIVLWSPDLAQRDRETPHVDAVLERGTTFRQLVKDLRSVVEREGASPSATRAAEKRQPLPVPSIAVLDRSETTGALLLRCDSCRLELNLSTVAIDPAVDAARAFFLQHDACRTAIDLTQRQPVGANA